MKRLKNLLKSPYNYFFRKDEILRFAPEKGGVRKKYSKFQSRIFQLKSMQIKYRQKRQYATISSAPDYSLPYIFLALHTEAKRTTNPAGGHYADQVLILNVLLSVIPDEWFIYIKEHPAQLDLRKNSQRPRRKGYYNQFRTSDRVKFIRMEEIPFNLIDNAKAVATICGDPGWEAVNRGVPALVFGKAWYSGCEGVFTVSTLRDCRQAVEALNGGYEVDEERVKLFWSAIEICTERASVSVSNRIEHGIDYDKNVSKLADMLAEKIVGQIE